jgi:hypothetical protein
VSGDGGEGRRGVSRGRSGSSYCRSRRLGSRFLRRRSRLQFTLVDLSHLHIVYTSASIAGLQERRTAGAEEEEEEKEMNTWRSGQFAGVFLACTGPLPRPYQAGNVVRSLLLPRLRECAPLHFREEHYTRDSLLLTHRTKVTQIVDLLPSLLLRSPSVISSSTLLGSVLDVAKREARSARRLGWR